MTRRSIIARLLTAKMRMYCPPQKRSAPEAPISIPFIHEEDMIELQSTNNATSTSDDHVPYTEEEEDRDFPPPSYTQCTASSTSSTAPSSASAGPVLPGISISTVQQPQTTLTAQQFERLYGHVEEVRTFNLPQCRIPTVLSLQSLHLIVYITSLYL